MVNKITLLGRVGQQPEVKDFEYGAKVVNFSLATTEYWKDKDGNKQEKTEWHRCFAWRKLADIINDYVNKGDLLYIEGKLVYNQYEKDGEKRTVAKIDVREVKLMPKGNKSEPAPEPEKPREAEQDDLPF